MEHIVSETNKYAQQVVSQMLENHSLHPKSRICKWRDTTVDELFVFFGIILAMGVVVKTSDNEDTCTLRLEYSEARLYKIQPILSHLNNKFQEMYRPAQNLALDESIDVERLARI
ncbi:hypothetical protein PYW07_009204 [Mythimna separata]|uniref:PiggyBac transposable element-derived protein domain-containing protein n=1 Tax=Mythimna separata TaxID=271217 RepID=A0AAD7YC30_MYTSE|nr:hypothetical protein PYW07_009204 [Mythimna separata]